jgi:hypothetical protein
MKDLNNVHGALWIVGSLGNINPLHHQKVLLRQIIPSESPRLHLLWFGRTIYIKPLPTYLLNTKYYEEIICKDFDLYALIVGFLLSYISLIQTPVDLEIAKETYLIPKDVSWQSWAIFREAVLTNTKNAHVDKRYQYGELRLARLDLIWRCTGRGLTYFTVHREYGTYFNQYFGLLVTAFVFVTAILTAMQIAVTVTGAPKEVITVCYRFSVAVMIGACVCFAYIAIVFLAMFLYNTVIARIAHWKGESV